MSAFIIAAYLVLFFLAFAFFLFNLWSLKIKKKSLGKIQASWSSFYNFNFPFNWFVLPVLFAYFLWCMYQIFSEPESNSGYFRLLILIIFLAFTPRWNGYIGSDGILFHMKFIPWERVKNKQITGKGKRKYLEINEVLTPDSSEFIKRRIPLSKNTAEILK